MSKFRIHTGIGHTETAIVEAIVDCIKKYGRIPLTESEEMTLRNSIEIHETPVNLYGYKNDKRQEKANIVLRRNSVNRYLSKSDSNDIGFQCDEKTGEYIAHISDYDKLTWFDQAEERFYSYAAAWEAREKAELSGLYESIDWQEEGEKILLYCHASS